MISASVDIRVRYKETDKMGVVYHSNYFTWFEVARIELLDKIGCPYFQLESEGFFLPVLSCSASFHLPAVFDDRLTVKVKIEKMPTVRIQANYQVNRGDVELATGYTEHAFVSSEGGVVRPPERFVENISKLFSS